jgi:hypothetical protein
MKPPDKTTTTIRSSDGKPFKMQPVLTKAEPAGIVVPENGPPALAPPKIELSSNDTNASTSKQEPEHDDDDDEWEKASLYEDVLDDMSPYDYPFSRFH